MDREKLYQIAKIIAENDSVVGEGYRYCDDYTREKFAEELKRESYGWVDIAEQIYELFCDDFIPREQWVWIDTEYSGKLPS